MDKTNFKEKKEIIKLQGEVDFKRHQYRMEELAMERENSKITHDLQLEVIRIKSAEIRRSQQRKDFNY